MTEYDRIEIYNVINQKGFLEYSDLVDYVANNEKYGHSLFGNVTHELNVPWIVEYLKSRKREAKEQKNLDNVESRVLSEEIAIEKGRLNDLFLCFDEKLEKCRSEHINGCDCTEDLKALSELKDSFLKSFDRLRELESIKIKLTKS